MTGFIRGLFNKKSEANSQQSTSDVFYLDNDDAKGLGDVNRFKDMPEVKKSYPKLSGGKPFEAPKPKLSINTSSVITPSSPSIENNTSRRRADSSMDMFRNMAREIKKP